MFIQLNNSTQDIVTNIALLLPNIIQQYLQMGRNTCTYKVNNQSLFID